MGAGRTCLWSSGEKLPAALLRHFYFHEATHINPHDWSDLLKISGNILGPWGDISILVSL
jgi:hypothetical protein